MLLIGSSGNSLSAGTLVLIACFSAVCLVNGVRHYHGRGTWLLRWLPTEVSFFAGVWYGAFGLLVVLCELARHVSVVLEAVLAIPTFALGAFALMSFVWLPSRLLPEWYLERRRQRHSAAAAIR